MGHHPKETPSYLTRNPLRCRICCDIDPDELSAVKADDDDGIEQVEANVGTTNKSMTAIVWVKSGLNLEQNLPRQPHSEQARLPYPNQSSFGEENYDDLCGLSALRANQNHYQIFDAFGRFSNPAKRCSQSRVAVPIPTRALVLSRARGRISHIDGLRPSVPFKPVIQKCGLPKLLSAKRYGRTLQSF